MSVDAPSVNGSKPAEIAAAEAEVAAARARLGTNLERLSVEVRAQVGQTMQKTAWKGSAALAAIVAGVLVRKLLIAGWQKARKSDPPANPAAPGTTWSDALAWTVASGVAVGLARLVAQRGAAAGWRRWTGTLPPGMEEVAP